MMTSPRLQLGRFGIVGGAASLTHIVAGLWAATSLGLSPLVANVLAFSLAVLISYLGNHGWTFERSGRHDRHFPRFVAVSLIGLAINQAIIFASVELAGWPYFCGLLLVIMVVPTLTFLLSRYWAFVDGERPVQSRKFAADMSMVSPDSNANR